MSPTQKFSHVEATDTEISELTAAIENGEYFSLSEVITNQSSREDIAHSDILADALAICCANGHLDMARRLLAEGDANPNKPSCRIREYTGMPPLVLAVSNCQKDSPVTVHFDTSSTRSASSTLATCDQMQQCRELTKA